jgi:hypothetical protein
MTAKSRAQAAPAQSSPTQPAPSQLSLARMSDELASLRATVNSLA